jgi:hypothetical protein
MADLSQVSDLAGLVVSVAAGDFLGAGMSAISLVP